MSRNNLTSYAVRPVVGRFVDAHLFQAQVVAEGVPVSGSQDVEGGLCEILRSRYDVEDDGLVVRQAGQEVTYRFVAAINQKGVIPGINQFFPGDVFDIGEVHHHALFGQSFSGDDVPGQGDLDRIAMAVQVFALAVVVGDAMSGIEFKAARDIHDGLAVLSAADYTLSGFEGRRALQEIAFGVIVIRRAVA
jgi:hypothetical protein